MSEFQRLRDTSVCVSDSSVIAATSSQTTFQTFSTENKTKKKKKKRKKKRKKDERSSEGSIFGDCSPEGARPDLILFLFAQRDGVVNIPHQRVRFFQRRPFSLLFLSSATLIEFSFRFFLTLCTYVPCSAILSLPFRFSPAISRNVNFVGNLPAIVSCRAFLARPVFDIPSDDLERAFSATESYARGAWQVSTLVLLFCSSPLFNYPSFLRDIRRDSRTPFVRDAQLRPVFDSLGR